MDSYLDTIRDAGFTVELVRDSGQYRLQSASAVNATATWGVKSVSILARRDRKAR